MNWSKIKQDYPNTYPLLKQYHYKTGLEGRSLIVEFLTKKGYQITVTFINALREFEQSIDNSFS